MTELLQAYLLALPLAVAGYRGAHPWHQLTLRLLASVRLDLGSRSLRKPLDEPPIFRQSIFYALLLIGGLGYLIWGAHANTLLDGMQNGARLALAFILPWTLLYYYANMLPWRFAVVQAVAILAIGGVLGMIVFYCQGDGCIFA
ncbi:MAG: hypothetical protein HUJ27_09915 [Rhodobacteraceae bacterium]|nr:hypothetical protein [Paracoccaceae bacterium]